jgi:hypothetical protein
MCPALNMAIMAQRWFSRSGIEEKQQLLKKPHAEVWEEKKWGVQFQGHNRVKAAMERHLAMVRENQMEGCLPSPNGTGRHPQRLRRRKGEGAPRSRRAPSSPESPAGPSDDDDSSETEGMPPAYIYIHTAFPSTFFLARIACAIRCNSRFANSWWSIHRIVHY